MKFVTLLSSLYIRFAQYLRLEREGVYQFGGEINKHSSKPLSLSLSHGGREN